MAKASAALSPTCCFKLALALNAAGPIWPSQGSWCWRSSAPGMHTPHTDERPHAGLIATVDCRELTLAGSMMPAFISSSKMFQTQLAATKD